MPAARPPRLARLLGFAGLLPPLVAIGLLLPAGGADMLGDTPRWMAGVAGLLYGALILSFLGGLWWGIAAARLSDSEMEPLLVLAVLPSLWAMGALLAIAASALWTGALLALGLVAALIVDRRLVRLRAAPDWWMALRVPLSLGLAPCMLALGWLVS